MNEIKGLYLVVNSESRGIASEGILKKIKDQIHVLNESYINCQLFEIFHPQTSLLYKVLECYVPFFPDSTKWDYNDVLSNVNFVYIRRPAYISAAFLNFLREIKIRNKHVYILLEIPTYPYEKEFSKLKFGILLKDMWNRKKLYRYVDSIVDLFGNSRLFGIPTIQIRNGTPVTEDSKRVPCGNTKDIKMVCAANFSFWHGLDRLIEGLYIYFNNGGSRNITLDIIGGGDELAKYQQQVKQYNLEKKIHFLGSMSREDVFKKYNNYNLGVESLARHRTGSTVPNSSLKSRDYLNVGIPFFGEGEVDVLAGYKFPYYYQVPSSDSPVNIDTIINFFDSIYKHRSESSVIDEMHNFAYRTVDMHVSFQNVIRAINLHCLHQ